MKIELVIERTSTNRLNSEKLADQVKTISIAANKRTSAPGVEGTASKVQIDEQEKKYHYSFKVTLEKNNFRSENAAQKALEAAKKIIIKTAERFSWTVKGDAQELETAEHAASYRQPFKPGDLTEEVKEDFFAGIYERDAHIRLIHASTQTALDTDFEERNHTLLFGEPAAAKTTIFNRFKDWYECNSEGVERVAYIDVTTLSKAGLENWILERAKDQILPEILFFNELEKFNPDNLLCLLSIMDGCGVITKINAKIGRQSAKVRCLVWGTCNNAEKIKNWEGGALWSRFAKALPCYRPSRELMVELLLRNIAQRRNKGRKADDRWAKVAVDYAFDTMGTNDPRAIVGLLDGGHKLLTGEYQRDLELATKKQ